MPSKDSATRFNVMMPQSKKNELDEFWRKKNFKNRNEFVLTAIENFMREIKRQELYEDLKRGYIENAEFARKTVAEWDVLNTEL